MSVMICLHAAASLVCVFTPSSLMVDCRKEQPLTMRIARPEIQDQHSAQESKYPCTPTALGGNSHAPKQSLSNKKIQEGSPKKWHYFFMFLSHLGISYEARSSYQDQGQ